MKSRLEQKKIKRVARRSYLHSIYLIYLCISDMSVVFPSSNNLPRAMPPLTSPTARRAKLLGIARVCPNIFACSTFLAFLFAVGNLRSLSRDRPSLQALGRVNSPRDFKVTLRGFIVRCSYILNHLMWTKSKLCKQYFLKNDYLHWITTWVKRLISLHSYKSLEIKFNILLLFNIISHTLSPYYIDV